MVCLDFTINLRGTVYNICTTNTFANIVVVLVLHVPGKVFVSPCWFKQAEQRLKSDMQTFFCPLTDQSALYSRQWNHNSWKTVSVIFLTDGHTEAQPGTSVGKFTIAVNSAQHSSSVFSTEALLNCSVPIKCNKLKNFRQKLNLMTGFKETSRSFTPSPYLFPYFQY